MKKLTVYSDRYEVEEQSGVVFSREIHPKKWTPVPTDYDVVVDKANESFEQANIKKLSPQDAEKRADRLARIIAADTERKKAAQQGIDYISPRMRNLQAKIAEAVEKLPEPVKKVLKNRKEA